MTRAPDASLVDHHASPTRYKGLTIRFGERVPAPGELIEVAPGVHWTRLPVPGSLNHINVWAVEEEGGVAIVDTGLPLDACKDAWRAVFDGPLAGQTVTRVIVTHMHPDHVGLAGWLTRKFGVRLWMTRGEYLTRGCSSARPRASRPKPPPRLARRRLVRRPDRGAKPRAGATSPARCTPAARRLCARDRRDRLRAWRAVSAAAIARTCVPGRRSGAVMIAGDQVLPRISPNVSLNDAGAGRRSARRMAGLDRQAPRRLPDDLLVLPAHGSPFTGLHARLDALIDGHPSGSTR